MGYLTSLTAQERFFLKVDRESGECPDYSDPLVLVTESEGPCWVWRGGYNSNGYPRYNPKSGLGTVPYRISWRYLVGEIESGLHLDHLCRNPGCVNPSHLEPVTPGVNALRSDNPLARNARKTHCSRNHEFTSDNTRIDRNGHRHCKVCERVTNTEWARRKRARIKQEEQ